MRRRLGAIAAALVGAARLVAACGDDATPIETSADAATSDVVVAAEASSPADTGVPSFDFGLDAAKESGPVDCRPSLAATFAPQWTSPVRVQVCATADIAAYYDACLDLATNRTLTSPECVAFREQKAACGNCIERADGTGPIRTFRDRAYFEQNLPSCVAIVQKSKGGTEECGKAYFEYEECRRQSCDGCFDLKGASFNDYLSCKERADDSGACLQLGQRFDDSCRAKGYKLPATGAPECFGTGTDASARRTFFQDLIRISCGT